MSATLSTTGTKPRIISLLPSVTEILFAIGAGQYVVGTTHECDYPPCVGELPNCTSSLLPPDLSASEIDTAVSKSIQGDPHSIYTLNEDVVRNLKPSIIITQSLCAVCAVPQEKVENFACTLPQKCKIIASDPHTLDQLFETIKTIGNTVGQVEGADKLITSLMQRLKNVRDMPEIATKKSRQKHVIVLEWPDPPFAPGHWVPQQIETAGGFCALGVTGVPSRRVSWDELHKINADVVVGAFCGYDLKENEKQIDLLKDNEAWNIFTKEKVIYATNASAYFSRPGNRLVDGVELLAYILHSHDRYRPLESGHASRLTDSGWIDLYNT